MEDRKTVVWTQAGCEVHHSGTHQNLDLPTFIFAITYL